jgi:hypothetical protein
MSKRVTLLLMGIGLVILGSALVMPWITIGGQGFSLSYIYIAVFNPAVTRAPFPFTVTDAVFENISQLF